MTVGFAQGRAEIDQKAGSTALGVKQALQAVADFKEFLDGKTDQNLTALGCSTDDVALLRSAMIDLAKLGQIAKGQATQAEASNFFWFARHLTGVI